MNPYQCRFALADGTVHEGAVIMMAVGNGRYCGGGYQVTPRALLNDGLLDVVVIHDVELNQFGSVLTELLNVGAEDGEFVGYAQVPSLSIESDQPMQLNLDGEPMRATDFEFSTLAGKLPFILPASELIRTSL